MPEASRTNKTLLPAVLVVDDDSITVELLSKHLAAAGHSVLTASDGPRALEALARHAPPMLILDWEMPGMDGPAVCRAVRATRSDLSVYIIMLTVHAAKDRLLEAYEAGVDDFLTKPFDADELLARLRAGARASALQAELARRVRQADRLNARLARLNARLRQMARTDELTGLPNRRHAIDRLKLLWDSHGKTGRPFSLTVIDVDDFKRVNDERGHAAGDAVLREVAALLGRELRGTDAIARVGGEEFLILFPDQTAEQALAGCERLRQTMRSHVPATLGRPIAFSAGVAQRTVEMTRFEDLLHRADEALYAAKRAGKDRAVISRAAADSAQRHDPKAA